MVIGLLTFLARSALAQVQVEVVVSPTPTTAPARLTVTASLSQDAVVLDRAWTGLGRYPFCGGASCSFEAPTGACRRVSVEVTTVDGDVATASAQACADGLLRQRPPQVNLSVEPAGGGVTIRPTITVGSSPLLDSALYVDDQRRSAAEVFHLDADGGCHAIDLFAADAAGFYALEQRTVCTDADAPRLELGAPDPCPAVDAEISWCSRGAHPLGLPLSPSLANWVLDGCTVPAIVRPIFERHLAVATDPDGRKAHASLFTCAHAPGDPRLFFLAPLEDQVALEGEQLGLAVRTGGGSEPYSGVATVSSGTTPITSVSLTRLDGLLDLRGVPAGDYTLRVELLDGRGLLARTEGSLMVLPMGADIGPRPDGGTPSDGGSRPPSALNNTGAGCTALEGAPAWWIGAVVLALGRRRRK